MPFLISLLAGPLGSIIKWGLGIIAAVLIVWGGLAYYKHEISAGDLAKYNQAQLEQIITDQKTQAAQLQTIQDNQKKISDDLAKANEVIQGKYAPITDWLNSPTVQKEDSVASKLLTDTLNKMKDVNTK
ncbi:MAG: hypothetical protein P4M11_01920 [Candidatus Pacebacteria bacterium]|nr:hypothetical protein [Candidatus Paceibacterota bacterium]